MEESKIYIASESNVSKNIIPGYRLENTIGTGTFGKVKLGVNLSTNEKVAIKILEKDKICGQEEFDRIMKEMRYLKSLDHPNIIKVFEILETERCYYIVMEYASGGELFHYIVKKKRLTENEANYFFFQIINGLDYIHKNKVAHRDLKPENLLLKDENDKLLKIIDFGLSNDLLDNKQLVTPCGSPCYAAPEMVLGKKYSGVKIDIWSAGITLFAMSCGWLPFEDKLNENLFKKIIECKVDYPSFMPFIHKDLLKKILVPNPVERLNLDEIKKHPVYVNGKILFMRENKHLAAELSLNDFNTISTSSADVKPRNTFSPQSAMQRLIKSAGKKEEFNHKREASMNVNLKPKYKKLSLGLTYKNPKIEDRSHNANNNTLNIKSPKEKEGPMHNTKNNNIKKLPTFSIYKCQNGIKRDIQFDNLINHNSTTLPNSARHTCSNPNSGNVKNIKIIKNANYNQNNNCTFTNKSLNVERVNTVSNKSFSNKKESLSPEKCSLSNRVGINHTNKKNNISSINFENSLFKQRMKKKNGALIENSNSESVGVNAVTSAALNQNKIGNNSNTSNISSSLANKFATINIAAHNSSIPTESDDNKINHFSVQEKDKFPVDRVNKPSTKNGITSDFLNMFNNFFTSQKFYMNILNKEIDTSKKVSNPATNNSTSVRSKLTSSTTTWTKLDKRNKVKSTVSNINISDISLILSPTSKKNKYTNNNTISGSTSTTHHSKSKTSTRYDKFITLTKDTCVNNDAFKPVNTISSTRNVYSNKVKFNQNFKVSEVLSPKISKFIPVTERYKLKVSEKQKK